MNEEDFICDYCGIHVDETEINDCEPDEYGFCINCGELLDES